MEDLPVTVVKTETLRCRGIRSRRQAGEVGMIETGKDDDTADGTEGSTG